MLEPGVGSHRSGGVGRPSHPRSSATRASPQPPSSHSPSRGVVHRGGSTRNYNNNYGSHHSQERSPMSPSKSRTHTTTTTSPSRRSKSPRHAGRSLETADLATPQTGSRRRCTDPPTALGRREHDDARGLASTPLPLDHRPIDVTTKSQTPATATLGPSPVSPGRSSDAALVAERKGYFQKLDKYHRRPRPLPNCPSRRRIQGTRNNGAIRFHIDMDTPGGHKFPFLLLVQGIVTYEDSDSEEDVHHDGMSSPTQMSRATVAPRTMTPSQRPPTPPKSSHRHRTPRAESLPTEADPPRGQGVTHRPKPHATAAATQGSTPASTSPPPRRTTHILGDMGDRAAPLPRDSGTLAETLENSSGSDSVTEDDDESPGPSPEPSPGQSRLSWRTATHSTRQRNTSCERDMKQSVSDESDYDETTESEEDDADEHVKGYIHNYVQTQFHTRLAQTVVTSRRTSEAPVVEEEQSIDPLDDFNPRKEEEMSVQDDSYADIQDSFAVASMDEYSAPSVDYGYNEDVVVEQTESGSSISAKEIEPATLNPVLVSPVTTTSSGSTPVPLPRKRTITAPLKSAMRQSVQAWSTSNSTLSTNSALTKSHASSPRPPRGSQQAHARVRQPSIVEATPYPDHRSPRQSSQGSRMTSSGLLQHSQESMGSSESDSSAFQSINPYAMPESALDQSMAFMQFDFRSEMGVTLCETNEDVQVADSSEEESIDEFKIGVQQTSTEVTSDEEFELSDQEQKKTIAASSQRTPPRLPVRNKTNEDMPSQVAPQRGLRGLVRNFSHREASSAAMGIDASMPGSMDRGTPLRSSSTDSNLLSPKRGLMRNFSNRAGRSTSSERTEENKRQGRFRAGKPSLDKDATKDIVKKFFNFGNASCSSLSLGQRLDGSTDQNDLMEDEVSLLLDT